MNGVMGSIGGDSAGGGTHKRSLRSITQYISYHYNLYKLFHEHFETENQWINHKRHLGKTDQVLSRYLS
jgi:hypothetical protein